MAKEESGGKFPHLDNSADKGDKEENPNNMRRKEMKKKEINRGENERKEKMENEKEMS